MHRHRGNCAALPPPPAATLLPPRSQGASRPISLIPWPQQSTSVSQHHSAYHYFGRLYLRLGVSRPSLVQPLETPAIVPAARQGQGILRPQAPWPRLSAIHPPTTCPRPLHDPCHTCSGRSPVAFRSSVTMQSPDAGPRQRPFQPILVGACHLQTADERVHLLSPPTS